MRVTVPGTNELRLSSPGDLACSPGKPKSRQSASCGSSPGTCWLPVVEDGGRTGPARLAGRSRPPPAGEGRTCRQRAAGWGDQRDTPESYRCLEESRRFPVIRLEASFPAISRSGEALGHPHVGADLGTGPAVWVHLCKWPEGEGASAGERQKEGAQTLRVSCDAYCPQTKVPN